MDNKTPTGVAITPLKLNKREPSIVSGPVLASYGSLTSTEETSTDYDTKGGDEDEFDVSNISDDDDFQELCKECVIRDIEGCNHCGIYIYGYKHKQFVIKVKRYKKERMEEETNGSSNTEQESFSFERTDGEG